MVEPNITRRRLVQGAGAIGVAGIVGTSGIVAQDEQNETQEQPDSPAIRVAHASPDAPAVDVRLQPGAGGPMEDPAGDDPAAGNETDNETDDEDDGVFDTDDDQAQNETQNETQDEAEETTIEEVEFRDVSEYTEVDAGSYTVEVVPAGEGGLIDSFLNDDEEQDQVVFEDQLEVEESTTYTVVAFGELGQADSLPVEGQLEEADGMTDGTDVGDQATDDDPGMGDEAGQNETAQNETIGQDDEPPGQDDEPPGQDDEPPGQDDEPPGQDDEPPGQDDQPPGQDGQPPGQDQGFQVTLLEDDISDPGEDMSRLRVFHAVPDVQAVSISQAQDGMMDDGEMDDGGMGDQNETTQNETTQDDPTQDDTPQNETTQDDPTQDDPTGQEALIEDLAFGETDTVEVPSGDYTLEIRGVQPPGQDEQPPGQDEPPGQEDGGMEDDGGMTEEPPEQDDSPGQNETAGQGDQTGQAGQVREADVSLESGTAYSGFALGFFDPEAAADGMQEDDQPPQNETDQDGMGQDEQNETAQNETTEQDDDLAEDVEGEEFELVTVVDAENGERADGGTGDDGLFSVASVPTS